MSARSKAWVCSRSLAGIAGSNPVEGVDVCCECCVLLSLRRSDHSSGGVIPSVVCLRETAKPRKWGGPGPLGGCCDMGGDRS